MLHRIQYRDWEKAFFDVIPKRKFDDKSRKQKRKEAREQADIAGGLTPEEHDDGQQAELEGETCEEGFEAEERDEEAEANSTASNARDISGDTPPQATVSPLTQ